MIFRKIIYLLFSLSSFLWAESPSLTWQDNNEPFFAGFRVYYRTAFETEEKFIDVGSRTEIKFPSLKPETKYFCRLTAYNIFGLESPPSEEITFFTRPSKPSIKRLNGAMKMVLEGRQGSSVDLYESTNLADWKFVRTLHNVDGTLDLTTIDTFSGPQKFYRVAYSGDTLEGWLLQQPESEPASPFPGTDFSQTFAYSVGLDLTNDPSKAQPKVGTIKQNWEGAEETFTTFSFHIREGSRDITPTVEASHDGEFWFEVTPRMITVESTLLGNGVRRIVLREPLPLGKGASPCCLYRLRFDGPAEAKPIRFSEWLARKGNPAPEGDLYKNGIGNFYSFATGTDLLPDHSDAHPSVGHESLPGTSSSYAKFSYRLRNGMEGVIAKVEFLDPEEGWQSADSITSLESTTPNYDGTTTITLRETSPIDSQTPRLFRVKYEEISP